MSTLPDDLWHTDAGAALAGPLDDALELVEGTGESIEAAVERFLALAQAFETLRRERAASSITRELAGFTETFLAHGRELGELGPEYAELALEAFTLAASADPRSAEARRERSAALLDVGREAEAAEEAEAALRLAPEDLPTVLAAAVAFVSAERPDDALRLEPEALALARESPLAAEAQAHIEAFFGSLRTTAATGVGGSAVATPSRATKSKRG